MKHTRGEKQKSKDREMRALYEKYRELNRVAWSQPLVQLAKPIQKGYKKSLTLRDDIANRGDALTFWTILRKIDSTIYSSNQEFKVFTKKDNKVFTTEKEHVPRSLTAREFEKWAPPPNIAKHFVFVRKTHTTRYGNFVTEQYEFATPWMFKSGPVEPHFLTHKRAFLPDVEKQLGEIKRTMDSTNFWNEATKILNWNKSKELRGTLEDKKFNLYFREQIEEIISDYACR